ncbi:hypothetical protein ACTFIN_11730 [Clostridium cagae]|nr:MULTISPECIES: hypothetical protein [unclassified Clostridium]
MNRLNLDNQLDEKTRLLISEMEKELKLKNSQIQSRDKEINN